MDDIEQELFNAGEKLGMIARPLRIREAEIAVREAQLAMDLGGVISRLDEMQEELRLLATRWHATYPA